jgi:uncharacterized protein
VPFRGTAPRDTVQAPWEGWRAVTDVLEAPLVLEFPYTRSTGPIIGAFLTGLRDGRVLGIRARDGAVLVPPQEYDPVTSEPLDELVEVGTSGEIVSWSWNPTPRPGQPLDRPFAWVLVRLDGADAPLLHALDVDDPSKVATGARVRLRWAAERVGAIGDIACFEPAADASAAAPAPPVDATDPVRAVTTPVRLEYRYTPGHTVVPFLRGTQERKLLGRRCSRCEKVYLPPRGGCPMCGADFTDEQVEVAHTGTVATFAIVNVNFAGREVDLPYAAVEVLLDGADITTQFLLKGIPLEQARMGMRVRAIWSDEEDLEPGLSNITHVEPIDEPDAPFEMYAEHV